MKVRVVEFFDAAHQLTDSTELTSKHCTNIHGHTYKCEVVVESDLHNGFVLDFGIVKEVLRKFDHRKIEDVFMEVGFNGNSTAENICLCIERLISEKTLANVMYIKLWEGYRGDEYGNAIEYIPRWGDK